MFTVRGHSIVIMQMGGGGVRFSGKKPYEGVRFNVIIALQGGGWDPISRKCITFT